jgi:SpoVK/Ycf46/Vps4 family AAA+-type ATPase
MRRPSEIVKSARTAARSSARLPAKDLAQVRAIAARANGFVRSKGKTLLFSGTNAAAAAEAMAKQLRLGLYRVGLAAVTSKYIGETEKNLERVFAEAEAAGALLLLDEADALFGKRTSVKDAHDRFSNLEVGYLLRRAGAYDGLVVLASKPKLALSIALRRRFSVYDFPPP